MINDPAMLRHLVQQVAGILLERQHTLITAESCTGGGIGFVLTDLAGSSAWLEGGFITYTNAAKHQHLHVPVATVARYGAVSEPTARAMAEGALQSSQADYSLSVTGIAGPTGGSPAKPVGTVCFAWADRPGRIAAQTRLFTGSRAAVREQAIAHALTGLLRFIRATDAAAE